MTKEMKYMKEYRCYVLDKGNYKGFNYVIMSYGTHPCSYVFLPKGHKFYGKSYQEIDDSFEDGLCHCGLTYSESDLRFNPLPNDCWVIGWDYSHCEDFSGLYIGESAFENLKKWTTEELIEEMKQVIDKLKESEDKMDEHKEQEMLDCIFELEKKNKTLKEQNAYLQYELDKAIHQLKDYEKTLKEYADMSNWFVCYLRHNFIFQKDNYKANELAKETLKKWEEK